MISGAKRLGVRLLVGLLVIAMAAFGLESFLLSGSSQGAVKINGEEIYQAQLDNAAIAYRNQLVSTYGQQYVDNLNQEGIAAAARQQLVQQTVLRQQAAELGLAGSDDMVNQLMAQMPELQVDGRFSIDALQSLLQSNRISLAQLQDNLRTEMGQNLLIQSFSSSQAMHQRALDQVAGLLFASADLLYADIDVAELASGITPTEAQLAAYYADNTSDFVQAAKGDFHYLRIGLDDLSNTVARPNNQAIELAYQEHLAELVAAETYAASHILVDTSSRSVQEAASLANELRARLDAGEDFADLAQAHSDDPGSAKQDGSLGKITLDSLVPEFSDQLRLLQPGEISQPVQSDFGYHIIRLDADPTTSQPSLEELRDQLVEKLIEREATTLYSEALEQLRNITNNATSLDAAAQVLGLDVALSPQITRTGLLDITAESDIFSQPRVREAAFAPAVIEQGVASSVINLHEQAIVLLRNNYTPERQLALEEVRAQLVHATTQHLAATSASNIAQAMLELQPQLDQANDKQAVLNSGAWQEKLLAQDSSNTFPVENLHIDFTHFAALDRIPAPIAAADTPTRQSGLEDRLREAVFTAAAELGRLKRHGSELVYLLLNLTRPRFNELSREKQEQVRQVMRSANAQALSSQLLVLLIQDAEIYQRR